MLPTHSTALVLTSRWPLMAIASAPARHNAFDHRLHVLRVDHEVVDVARRRLLEQRVVEGDLQTGASERDQAGGQQGGVELRPFAAAASWLAVDALGRQLLDPAAQVTDLAAQARRCRAGLALDQPGEPVVAREPGLGVGRPGLERDGEDEARPRRRRLRRAAADRRGRNRASTASYPRSHAEARTGDAEEDGGRTAGRYTPPVPREVKVSPMWVPALMFTLLGLGMIVIIINYLGVLPGGADNKYLLIGLVLITGGFITATRYR